MKTNARKYVGKVLPDGHLSLPEDTAKEFLIREGFLKENK